MEFKTISTQKQYSEENSMKFSRLLYVYFAQKHVRVTNMSAAARIIGSTKSHLRIHILLLNMKCYCDYKFLSRPFAGTRRKTAVPKTLSDKNTVLPYAGSQENKVFLENCIGCANILCKLYAQTHPYSSLLPHKKLMLL